MVEECDERDSSLVCLLGSLHLFSVVFFKLIRKTAWDV